LSIELRNISKKFGDFVALENINLHIETGELVALLGLSGSGKTTLLRIIAGLELPDTGEVLFHGEDATDVSVRDRKVGFVFQHYALFRHMTVFENVAFGLRVKPRRVRPVQAEIERRVHELLKLVQLDFLADRYPSQLSGGQRQRVALARTLAVEPKVLLLDEPFGALDAKVRQELRRWLRRLHDEIKITSVFVTHDQEEALELANRIVVMNQGHIEQIGSAEEVYHHPANAFVYNFLGNVNLFHGRIEGGKVFIGDTAVEMENTHMHAHPDGGKAVLYVRPHLLEIVLKPNGKQTFPATVKTINPAGPQVKVELVAAWGDMVQVELDHERYRVLHIQVGEQVYLRPKEQKLFIYQI
jgi:sulfate transport system ATP-binding protein